jgi:imidazolonepropionase-like amidohydrolase
MTLCLRGRCLPDGDERVLFLDGDRITFEPVAGAELIHDGGWLIPGLVDVHTHPGANEPGDELADDVLVDDLARHVDAGVALIRTPGIAGGVVPRWAMSHEQLPRIVPAGHWLAAPDGFFPGWGRHLEPSDLPAAAVEEADRSGGWCKVVVDWASGEGPARRYQPTVPPDVVVTVVQQVHAVGGRVAVHSQHPEGAEAAVIAGADSLEHGMHLRHNLLDRMAAQGTVLVPTMTAFSDVPARVAELEHPTWMSDYMEKGWQRHPQLVRAAHEAGVTVLAGTDSIPHGNVANEVELLASAGLPGQSAVGAASWSARQFLGYPGLEEGGLADITVYGDDPTVDVGILRCPALRILKGRVRLPS